VTRERATILERPWDNPAGRATAELIALIGGRVVGEHRHPNLVEQFTVLEGELTLKRARSDGAPARLPRDVPAAVPYGAGASDVVVHASPVPIGPSVNRTPASNRRVTVAVRAASVRCAVRGNSDSGVLHRRVS
jgi:hypothetical protein